MMTHTCICLFIYLFNELISKFFLLLKVDVLFRFRKDLSIIVTLILNVVFSTCSHFWPDHEDDDKLFFKT